MILFLLFTTGLLAGTIDAIAGGGGLISLPILLSFGVPPHVAFGTNKFQGTVGTFVATLKYYRHGLIAKEGLLPGILFGLIGGITGSVTSQMISSDFLRDIIPIFLFSIFIYTIFSPKMGQTDKQPRISLLIFYATVGFALAFYDGFLGPGTGSFWVFALTFFLGYNLIKATAYTKVFNLNSSFIATISFALGGNIDYRFAICMALGQLIGGRLGAYLAIHKGANLIRPVFLSVTALTLTSLIYKSMSEHGKSVQTFIFGVIVLALLGMYLFFSRRSKVVSSA